MNGWQQRLGSILVYALTTSIGVVAFLYPFWLPAVAQNNEGLAHANDAPLLLTILVGLAFTVLLLEMQTAAGSAKMARKHAATLARWCHVFSSIGAVWTN